MLSKSKYWRNLLYLCLIVVFESRSGWLVKRGREREADEKRAHIVNRNGEGKVKRVELKEKNRSRISLKNKF